MSSASPVPIVIRVSVCLSGYSLRAITWLRSRQTLRQAREPSPIQTLIHNEKPEVETSQSRGVFMDKVSHELRTPRDLIIAYVEWMNTSCERSERDRTPELTKIHGASLALRDKINTIIRLAQLESGRRSPERDLIRTTELVCELMDGLASNGREAIARVREARPSLAYLDVIMPEMDGFAFFSELRREEDWWKTPVISVSSVKLPEESRRHFSATFSPVPNTGVYGDPHFLDRLRDQIVRYLEHTEPVTELAHAQDSLDRRP